MHSTHNEGKSVVAERFIRTLKNKIYRHMTGISKNVYFDVLNDISDKYNNTYHRTIKMKLNQYLPPYRSSKGSIKVELDLSSYSTKTDLKNVTHVDVSIFASKTNLPNLKTQVDKLDIEKLKLVPNDLAKLSNIVKNDVVKKTEYNK